MSSLKPASTRLPIPDHSPEVHEAIRQATLLINRVLSRERELAREGWNLLGVRLGRQEMTTLYRWRAAIGSDTLLVRKLLHLDVQFVNAPSNLSFWGERR